MPQLLRRGSQSNRSRRQGLWNPPIRAAAPKPTTQHHRATDTGDQRVTDTGDHRTTKEAV